MRGSTDRQTDRQCGEVISLRLFCFIRRNVC